MADGGVGVVYIDGEMPKDELQMRIKQLVGSDTPPQMDLYCLGGLERKPNFANYATWKELDELMDEHDRSLVILDNWASLVRGVGESDNDRTAEVMDGPVMLRANGKSVLWVHHAGKPRDDGSRTQRGASAREDPLDYVLSLEGMGRPGGPCKFRAELEKSRRTVDWEPFTVELRQMPNGLVQWVRSVDELTSAERKVIEVLKSAEGPLTEKQIREGSRITNGGRARAILDKLAAMGRIVKVGGVSWALA